MIEYIGCLYSLLCWRCRRRWRWRCTSFGSSFGNGTRTGLHQPQEWLWEMLYEKVWQSPEMSAESSSLKESLDRIIITVSPPKKTWRQTLASVISGGRCAFRIAVASALGVWNPHDFFAASELLTISCRLPFQSLSHVDMYRHQQQSKFISAFY